MTDTFEVGDYSTNKEILSKYGGKLTQFERHEILNFPRIYFSGLEAKKVNGLIDGANNNGYDDENGFYLFVQNDHIAYQYQVTHVTGKGTYGQVVKAYDHKHGRYVALKMVRNIRNGDSSKLAEKEIKMLEFVRDVGKIESNVVHLLDHFTFRNHQCIVTELLGINLHKLRKRYNDQGFSIGLVRRTAYAILQCLHFFNKNGIIHRDLKPENILLKTIDRTGIKVIDFGSSCFDNDDSKKLNDYHQTRFYRAPEIILGRKYGKPIDMWSFGCILAELLTGYVFLAGNDPFDQLSIIIELLGLPPPKMFHNSVNRKGLQVPCSLDHMADGSVLVPGARKCVFPRSRDWNVALNNCTDELFISFLKRCLTWDSEERMTPSQALKHPWIRGRLTKNENKISKMDLPCQK